ncbi:hypothetical protein HU200_054071 [Digitaria exilis]|uniref:Uncharacterized protein n=1 Tax=Digitaria exilis TaxID=1010633 RepID=A0A835E4L4_9POAL|nr:hypothetical protein HU200_054071 [Digitaria exilis]
MRDEVMTCFRKYAILESHLDELCSQCFNVEDYNKLFHHYNFKVKMRKPYLVDWTIFGRKYYFCCPLEPNENGTINSCLMNQSLKYMC